MEINNPKVTVLMPVYNGEKYLAEAITSILTQTYVNFELLIINDGSRDRSVEIIHSYEDPRIRLIHNEQNLGLVTTLNKGMDLAQGEYIARMDQDDISMPNRLAKQLFYLEQYPDVGMCGTWIQVFGIGNYVEKYPTDHASIKASLLFYNALAHPTVMMRKKMFDRFNLRYDIDYLHAEDYELWQRCSNCFEIVNLGEVLLKYRTSTTSYCRVFTVEQNATLRRIDERNIKSLGINVSEEYLEMQKSLRSMQVTASSEFLARAAQWLEALHEANSKTKHYPEPTFSKIVSDFWFRICWNVQRGGFWVWRIYATSSLSRVRNQKNSARLYLFLKCCKQELKSKLQWREGKKGL